jgi:heat shock protein HtpX
VKRVFLFLVTNVAILVVLAVAANLLGLDRILDEQGTGLNLPALLGFAAVFGMGGSFLSLLLSKGMAKRMTGARVITDPRGPVEMWLMETVRTQAQAAGIGMPEVAIYDAPEPNAFATGARRDSALVAVSTGLLQSMDRREVESVLAHEVSHVANGDMVTLALIQGVVNTFVLFLSRVVGHAVDRTVFRTEEGHGPAFFVVSIVAQILFGILASIIVMWFSRQREFRADAGAARIAGRDGMIAALEVLKRASGQKSELPDQLNAFGIAGGQSRFTALFSSHPPLEERIARLRAMA